MCSFKHENPELNISGVHEKKWHAAIFKEHIVTMTLGDDILIYIGVY